MDTTRSEDGGSRPVFAHILNLLVILTIAIAAAGSAHAQEPTLPEGFHDGASGLVDVNSCTAFGWAVNPDNRDADVSVRVLSDGAQVAAATASDYGEDMARLGICPGGTCRFSIGLWGLVSPDQEHQILVQAYDPETDQWSNLESTPKPITCTAAFIWADPFHDVVNGWGWNDGDTLTLRVFDENGTEQWLQNPTRTYSAEHGAAFELRSEELPLHPGYRLTLDNGTITKELTVSPLEITDISPSTGTISGIYDPSLGFWINVQGQPPTHLAFEANLWTASFAELPAGAGGEVAQTDADGDMTGIGFFVPNPFLVAFPENDAVEAWEWPNGGSVHLSIDDPLTSDSPDYSADGTMAVTTWGDPRTYFRFEFNGQYDLKPGDTVTIDDGWATRKHTVSNLSVTEVSAGADTVAGTADAGAQVEVSPWGSDQEVTVPVTAGAGGAWLADFAGLFDIVAGTSGRSQIRDGGGNFTAVDWYLPVPWFTAFPEGNQVEGWDWPLGTAIHLTIEDPLTPASPHFEMDETVTVAPWGSGQPWVWFEFPEYDLKTGDIVTLTDGVTSKTHVVQNLSVTSVNVIENTVTGTATPGTKVTLWAWEDPEGRRLEVTANDSGVWAGDFDDVGYDVRQYNTVRAEVWDEFGNDTAVDRQTDYNYDIYIYDPLTGTIRQLTNSPDTDEYNPSWSPNGKLIAHDVVVRGASQGIYITDVKTGISTPLLGAEDGGNDAVWSPNGNWIAFDRNWAGGPNLYVVPATGGDPTVVREDAIGADWAPNGKRLVFQQPSDGSIRTVAVDGSRRGETLVANSGANPVWSPDGNWIAYENDGDIWKMNVNVQGTTFGEPIQVTSLSAKEEEPSWSADSQTIAFQTGLGGDYEIWTVSAAGGEPTWLVGAVEYGDYSPAYAKNGPAVAYAGASAEGQAARLWAATYTHEPGPWSEGNHSYHFADGASDPTPDLSFEVSAGAQAYDGHVLLRPWAMRTCTDGTMQDIPRVIAPEQPTLFHIGYVTDLAMTYPEAQAYFNSLMPNVSWDGGEAVVLVRHEIMPYQAEGRLADMCVYAQP